MSELACESLCYGSILKDVNLSVQTGQVCALLGPSGCGKTTLLWLLAGLWEPSSGRIKRDGGKLGMVFQQPGLWDHLTVEQHLKLVGADRTQRKRVLKQMNLANLRKRRPGKMSGGERQRLSIARALVIEPTWLLLDEPMAHLDGPTRQDLFGLLRDALKDTNAGVLIATHHAGEALRLADQTAVLADGQIAQHGPAAEVYRQPANAAVAEATGLASTFQGKIVRPEQLSFTPCGDADATIQRCEFIGPAYLLEVEVADASVTIWSEQPQTPGTRGAVSIKS